MPAITPVSGTKTLLNQGNRHEVVAKFASIADGDTWATGLGKVEMVICTPGASGFTIGATYSAGTVTFAVGGGPATNVMVKAEGLA